MTPSFMAEKTAHGTRKRSVLGDAKAPKPPNDFT